MTAAFFFQREKKASAPDPRYFNNRHRRNYRTEVFYLVAEYVVSGSGTVVSDGHEHKVRAGDFYFLNTGYHGHYYSDANDPICKKWINFTGAVPLQLLQAFQLHEDLLILPFNAEPYIDRFLVALSHRNEMTPEELESRLLHATLDLFLAIDRVRKQLSPAHSVSIGNIIAFIDENLLKNNITVQSLSDAFDISPRTMQRIFVSTLHTAPVKYIVYQKVEYAKRLLKEDISLEEISNRLHFSSEAYFRRVFVASTGVSPQQYRQMYRKYLDRLESHLEKKTPELSKK